MYNAGEDWPGGLSLVYAGGHVRGAGAGETSGAYSYYLPHIDGIYQSQQRDHDDRSHILKQLSCALTQCGSLSDD